jgi:hypothetical protein
MRDQFFEIYKTRVFKTILEIDRKAKPASLGDTLIWHYFNAGYSERDAAIAMIEVVTVRPGLATNPLAVFPQSLLAPLGQGQ